MRAVNLIPAEQRGGAPVGAGQSQGAVYGVIALLGGLAVLALLYGMAKHDVSKHRAEAAKVTAEAQQAQAQAQALAPYTSFIATREQRMQAVASLVDSRFDWAHVFHEFGRVLPAGIAVNSLAGNVGGEAGTTTTTAASAASSATAGKSSVASATPPGTVPTFTISGCANSQQEVALMLERLRLMDGAATVTLQSSTKSTSGGASSSTCPAELPMFTVQMTFDPLPAPSPKGPAVSTVAQTTLGAPNGGAR